VFLDSLSNSNNYYRLGLEIEALECVKDCKYSEGAIKLKGQLLDKMGMADDGRNYADKEGLNTV